MELTLKRIALKPTYTIGKLSINGKYFCDTLEDKVRDLNKNGKFDNGEKKVPGATAIPYGRYEVTLKVRSPRYSKIKTWNDFCGGYMPRLLKVLDFEGILIHAGNDSSHTDGCVLVGRNTVVGKLTDSVATFKKLYPILKEASDRGEKIFITIC